MPGTFIEAIGQALVEPKSWSDQLVETASGSLTSIFDVSGLATASIGAACLELKHYGRPEVERASMAIDRRLASFWFGMTIRPLGWTLPSPWDAIAGDYRSSDGWIRLHTNAPRHRAAALEVLGCAEGREHVAAAVAGWKRAELEQAIVDAGGCAAAMYSLDQWRVHPQGQAVASEPLIAWSEHQSIAQPKQGSASRLAGVKVLDLTRVLAGPVSTRFLSAFGAEVLRIDPPNWREPAVEPEVMVGKLSAQLDLARAEDRLAFEQLLRRADVLVHGYRPGALERLGYDSEARRKLNPGLIDVSLSANGWSGPWAQRRGFDSLVQMSFGIAAEAMLRAHADKPVPLPVQALDQATGYLMAAAVIRALRERRDTGRIMSARLSLARTAHLLTSKESTPPTDPLSPENSDDLEPEIEETFWGPARRVRFPGTIDGTHASWPRGARPIGTDPATWRDHV